MLETLYPAHFAPTTLPATEPDARPVGPFQVLDCTLRDAVATIAFSTARQPVAYALHVGGLNHRHDVEFVQALRSTPFVYADGVSVTRLARLAGARHIERAATTDIGPQLVETRAAHLGRPARLALIGGTPGLAEAAGAKLVGMTGAAEVVYATHGFHSDFGNVLTQLAAARPDIVIVGLGMPFEAKWVAQHLADLPPALIFTCGGWFGFLAGTERRAPKALQTAGLEWAYRLAQAPGRLLGRYASGLLTTVLMAAGQLRAGMRATRSRAAVPLLDRHPV